MSDRAEILKLCDEVEGWDRYSDAPKLAAAVRELEEVARSATAISNENAELRRSIDYDKRRWSDLLGHALRCAHNAGVGEDPALFKQVHHETVHIHLAILALYDGIEALRKEADLGGQADAQRRALLELARKLAAVAPFGDPNTCVFCNSYWDGGAGDPPHDDDCIWLQAQALRGGA